MFPQVLSRVVLPTVRPVSGDGIVPEVGRLPSAPPSRAWDNLTRGRLSDPEWTPKWNGVHTWCGRPPPPPLRAATRGPPQSAAGGRPSLIPPFPHQGRTDQGSGAAPRLGGRFAAALLQDRRRILLRSTSKRAPEARSSPSATLRCEPPRRNLHHRPFGRVRGLSSIVGHFRLFPQFKGLVLSSRWQIPMAECPTLGGGRPTGLGTLRRGRRRGVGGPVVRRSTTCPSGASS
jgi:hypothetical protein